MKTLKIWIAALFVCLPLVASAAPANDNPSKDAAKHFQRGVDLYNDGDFRGALVEFKKAYDVWPRANVLYDIGQTEYQLLDYATALTTMQRYLAETGANAPHRAEVEATVETLKGRVGHVILVTESGCDISVDEQPAGTTPLDQPILVSVGSRKVAVTCGGTRSDSKRIEVAAGETQRLELHPPPPPIAAVRAAMQPPAKPKAPSTPGQNFITSWIITGVFVGATVALGTTTLVEEHHLNEMRNTFGTQAGDLQKQQHLTTGLAITSDVLGVASVVGAGISTYLTVRHERAKRVVRVSMTGMGMSVGGTF